MKQFKKVFLSFILCALPFTLGAAELNNQEGWYAGAFGGVALSGNAKADIKALSSTSYKLKEKTSYGGGLALGYRFNEMRAELQASYQTADNDDIKMNGASVAAANFDGHLNSWNFMLNGYYDFSTDWVVEPFVGLGLGMSSVDTKLKMTTGNRLVEKTKTSLSYQGILGARYPVSDNVDLSLEYRYFTVSKFTVKDDMDSEWKINYDRHHILLGLNFAF